jgi:hypothetical protein
MGGVLVRPGVLRFAAFFEGKYCLTNLLTFNSLVVQIIEFKML